MKKNAKYLIIAGAAVVVLGGAAAALALTGGGETAEEASSAAASSSAAVTLINKTEADLASVTITNENGEIVLRAHTEEVVTSAASSEEDASSEASEPETQVVYEVEGLEGLALNSSSVSTVAKAGCTLSSQKTIGAVDDLTDFGLADPSLTVDVVYQDGSTFSYDVGIQNGSYYYVKTSESDDVYMASISSVLFGTVNDLADTSLYELEIGEDTSSAASIAQTTGTYTDAAIFDRIHLYGSAFEREVVIEYDAEDGYLMKEPRSAATDSTRMSNITSTLTSLSADSLVKAHPTGEELETYGLAEPAAVCEFTSGGNDYVLTVSAADADGSRYIVYSGIDAVFRIANDSVTAWADASPFYLQSVLTLLPNIVDVRTMTLNYGGEEYVFTIDRTVDEEESTEDNTAYTYTVKNADGLELDYEENFKHFYLAFISITVSEDTWEMPEGEPDLSCTYTYQEGGETDTIEYYKVSDRRYAIVQNGQLMGLALSDLVNTATTDLVLLNNGEEVPDPN